jgi:hypothetical protein
MPGPRVAASRATSAAPEETVGETPLAEDRRVAHLAPGARR